MRSKEFPKAACCCLVRQVARSLLKEVIIEPIAMTERTCKTAFPKTEKRKYDVQISKDGTNQKW